jgi:hydroxypyruvate reductase
VRAVEPSRLLASARSDLFRIDSHVYLIAAGKGAWPMAQAFVRDACRSPRAGIIAGPRTSTEAIPGVLEWFDAGHPSPNDASVAAADRALALAHDSSVNDGALVVLLSGGASAMLTAPVPGVPLADKIATSRTLMNGGLAIDELNCVRKHLSRIKGGRLAAAARRTITVAISDVHGPVADDPSVIGSGPTVADPTTFAAAFEIVSRFSTIAGTVRTYLQRGVTGNAEETIKPGDARLANASYEVIGNRMTALDGARRTAESLGYRVITIGEAIVGEASQSAAAFVEAASRQAASSPGSVCVLGGGETTVTVKGRGTGGRNQEFTLAAAPMLPSLDGDVVVASIGTDGADGPTDAAGAIADKMTIERSARLGLDWRSNLADNDAYHFFEPLGDLFRWGPTGTNVGDVQLFLRA